MGVGMLRRYHGEPEPPHDPPSPSGPTEEGPDPAPTADPADPVEAPAVGAAKAEWVTYAHKAHGVPLDEAEAMTKAALISKYGAN